MRVALIAPDWGNSWIPLLQKEIESRGHDFDHVKQPYVSSSVDVYLHAWAASQPIPGRRNVMFMRRYEFFTNALSKIEWEYVSDLIFCNSWIKSRVEKYFKAKGINTKTHLIYNAVDTSKWTFRQRKPNNKIGMVCSIHSKKNLPLAMDIISNTDYELHIAGELQDPCVAEYLDYMGKRLKNKVYMYGQIPREQLDVWWEQMGFCLSTSISEGNPNNVLEAMAKGIKPVVHHWPGAEDQFPHLFKTSSEAKTILSSDERHDSSRYLELVNERFSMKNIERAIDIAIGDLQ